METWAIFAAAMAGAAVAASVPRLVARKGARSGWLAAAPLTPTLAIMSVGTGIDWSSGLAVIAGATVGLVSPAVLRSFGVTWHPLPTMALFGAVAIADLLYLASAPINAAVFVGALLLGGRAYSKLPQGPPRKAPPKWRWALDFALTAGALLALPLAAGASPLLAGIVASSPLLLMASLATTQHQAGASGVLAVGRGAMGASLGVAAFVATAWALSEGTPALLVVVLGWAAFAAGVALWNRLTPSWRTAASPASTAGP